MLRPLITEGSSKKSRRGNPRDVYSIFYQLLSMRSCQWLGTLAWTKVAEYDELSGFVLIDRKQSKRAEYSQLLILVSLTP